VHSGYVVFGGGVLGSLSGEVCGSWFVYLFDWLRSPEMGCSYSIAWPTMLTLFSGFRSRTRPEKGLLISSLLHPVPFVGWPCIRYLCYCRIYIEEG